MTVELSDEPPRPDPDKALDPNCGTRAAYWTPDQPILVLEAFQARIYWTASSGECVAV